MASPEVGLFHDSDSLSACCVNRCAFFPAFAKSNPDEMAAARAAESVQPVP